MKNKWTQRPPEVKEGDYFFDGNAYITPGVQQKLSFEEITSIILDLQQKAHANNGIDYLQVYVNKHGEKIWIMDQLTKSQLATQPADWVKTNHFFTILLPEEY